MKQKVNLSFGTEKIELSIDNERLGCEPIAPKSMDKVLEKSPGETIFRVLNNPVGSPGLHSMVESKRVALIVSDEFRSGLHEEILDALIGEISHGKPSKLTVLCATGTHDPDIYTPNIRKWAEAASSKHNQPIEFIEHDCDDPNLIHIGTTSRGTPVILEPSWLQAEVRVFGHESKHHYMAGYSSVLKHVVPGISARSTVEANHKLALDNDSKAGQHPLHPDVTRRKNPFSEDALEALEMALSKTLNEDGVLASKPARAFLLDMISDKKVIFFAEAGDYRKVTSHTIEAADNQAMFEVPKSKYVVVSPGGPPASTALYGVQNCFDMALLGAIEAGGEALVLGPCNGRPGVDPDVKGLAPDRKSKKLFWDTLVRLKEKSLDECFKEIDENFQLYLWKTWRVLRLFKRDRIKIWIHGELAPQILAKGGFLHAPDPQEWIDKRVARKDGKFTIIDNGNKLLVRGKPA
ncbi:MAG: DUF2088 domain-containing protein [Deltaproteobacteria bacterium]|nr:DUF2088 domain-containing protein [Deltaproteobacteria bacterium]